MKTIGIVGSEGGKFTADTELKARALIRELIAPYEAVCSGECHMGGIDIWAKEEAIAAGKVFIPCPPESLTWGDRNGKKGFMARNKEIASKSDVVVCVTVKDLPPGFVEGGWERYCYHCKTSSHIKSGGCWTVKYAISLGKPGYTKVV